jgi:hypothetical protein
MGSSRYSEPPDRPWLDSKENRQKVNSSVGEPTEIKAGTQLSYYEEFCKHYHLLWGNAPVIFDTVNTYVEQKRLRKKNWAVMCEPFDLLLGYLDDDPIILERLIYANCDKLLNKKSRDGEPPEEKSVQGKGKPKKMKGSDVPKETPMQIRRRRKQIMNAMNTLIDYLSERAPFLAAYPNDEVNPLSGSRLRQILSLLKDLQRSEMEIDALKKEDEGKKARYAFDPVTGHQRRVGTTVIDPLTVLLIYVWKGKEQQKEMPLADEDFEAIVKLLDFWEFIPKVAGDPLETQITYLKDRLKHYRDKIIRFHPSGWNEEYVPMVYVD